jgi:hypothetical protein
MSFRKYGGTQYSANQNIVKSNINTTDKFYVTQNVGQPNTYINFESDISGNMTIYGDLDVSGNINFAGNLYQNGIPVDFSGNSQWTTTSGGIYYNSGNVGIGTSTPSSLLDVSGNATINGLTVGQGGGGNNSFNTAFGYRALFSNTSGGYFNTAIGYNSLYSNTTGYGNAANGFYALYYNRTGSYNTANGYRSLLGNDTGSNNTANGYEALYNNNSGSNNTAIGYNALWTVGSDNNTAIGQGAGYNLSGGSNNNTFLGSNTGVLNAPTYALAYNNSTAVGYNAIITASNQIILGTASEKIYIPGSYVGINKFTPGNGYALDVSGNVNATSYNSSSDYRIKNDIIPLDEKFTVDNLRPVTYNNTSLGKQDIGLIAHELQEVYPFLVNGEKDGENLQSVNYTGLIGILIKEIQDLKKEVKMLKEKICS